MAEIPALNVGAGLARRVGSAPVVRPLPAVHGPLRPSQQAVLMAAFEADALNGTLQRWQLEVGAAMVDGVRITVLALLPKVVSRTPMRTGRARNSWHVVLPGEVSSHAYTDHQGRAFDGSVPGLAAGPMEAYLASGLVYMPPLEAGWSRQAPAGMVAVSLIEMRGALERAVEERLPGGR